VCSTVQRQFGEPAEAVCRACCVAPYCSLCARGAARLPWHMLCVFLGGGGCALPCESDALKKHLHGSGGSAAESVASLGSHHTTASAAAAVCQLACPIIHHLLLACMISQALQTTHTRHAWGIMRFLMHAR
jgi:hypothetical protein